MCASKVVRFRGIKPEIRILGLDDGAFLPHTAGKADVVGVVFRGGRWLDGVMRTEVTIDGLDATERISSMVTESPHYEQLRVLMLSGITFAGFNVVDIRELFESTSLPVIALTRERSDLEGVRRALENLPDRAVRWRSVQSAGDVFQVKVRSGVAPVYVQVAGVSIGDAEGIVRLSCTRSGFPEPLRVAHLIASSLSKAGFRLSVQE
ncbi:MAG: DUF99 family protein [Candidatus Bathyarchaeota archaeon]|nr:DUF99 family protein [Candidatus Bathyarchaeota archaeon]